MACTGWPSSEFCGSFYPAQLEVSLRGSRSPSVLVDAEELGDP